MAKQQVVVIGAGMGGLAAAIDLAARGFKVRLAERHPGPGGKMHTLPLGGAQVDSGPTVFTMRYVFEDLFAAAGSQFSERVTLHTDPRLARHAWPDGSQLDLFADIEQSVAAIDAFAGATEAQAYRKFAADSEAMFNTLDHSFMRREKPGSTQLALSMGLGGVPRLLATRPFTSLWRALGQRFADPRLRQLFGRYATYCGSSPLQAPATLMLIAHSERSGVWRVAGGMQRLAEAMAALATELGVELHYDAEVAEVELQGGRASAVVLADGTRWPAAAVVFNGDVAALNAGLLGAGLARAVPPRAAEPRSLSAVTWSLLAATSGFELDHHTVFFGEHYEDEFNSIFQRSEITAQPTVYVCAQDRGAGQPAPGGRPERLLLLANAPPRGFSNAELEALEDTVFGRLQRMGLGIARDAAAARRSTPDDFARRFPGSGGAIYGWPTHGWQGSFKRWGSRAKVPGLYLAGGTVHPGPGIPMATLSGRLAAASISADLRQA
jgi:1-hydroxycarotenoid 3,4-desaturase